MPAILREVLKTNTFEQQRQIINTLAQDFYDYSLGSGFSTYLNLVDGTSTEPALFFNSERDLGIYKPSLSTLAITSEGNRVFDFSTTDINSYRPFNVKSTAASSISIFNGGQYYKTGGYSSVPVFGGAGSDLTVSVVVTPIEATITNGGSGYPAGTTTNVAISGGSGQNGTVDITAVGIVGTIVSGGSGYANFTYTDVPLQGGSGTGARATLTVSGGVVTSVTITASGSGYVNNNTLTVNNADLIYNDPATGSNVTSGGSGFSYRITNTPYVVTSVVPSSSWSGTGYLINDTATVTGVSGSGLQFTLTKVGYISSATLSNGGSGYSVNDSVSPTYAEATQDNYFGILNVVTYQVNVQATVDGNRYFINLNDGNGFVLHPDITFERDTLYNFIFPDPLDFQVHPLRFSATPDGIHGGGSEYTTDVRLLTQNSGIQILVTADTPASLYYYCTAHPDMSGSNTNEAVISVVGNAGTGASFVINSVTDSVTYSINLDGDISANSLILEESLLVGSNASIVGGTTIGGTLSVSANSTFSANLTVSDTLFTDSLNVADSLQVAGDFLVNTDQFYIDTTNGFIGINASDVENNPLSYSLELYGTFYNDGDVVLAETSSSIVNIGDTQGTSKLNVGGSVDISGELKVSSDISLNSSASISEPSLYFTDNRKVGLYYNSLSDYISLTGYTGELASFKHDSLQFYRDSNFNSRTVKDYIIIPGSGYTLGNYSNVVLEGGTGSGLIADITIAFTTKVLNPGSGYSTGEYPSVSLTGGSGAGAIATITISSGSIANNIQITDPGSGYESTPEVSFSDTIGSGAVAIATLSESGSLKTISLNNSGSGYTSTPTVVIGTVWTPSNTVSAGQQYFYNSNLYTVVTGGTFDSTTPPTHTSGTVSNGTAELAYAGSVAVATASLGTDVGVNDDQISLITVISAGSGYTVTPQISFTGGGGTGATASAVLQFTVASVEVLEGGQNYSSPLVNFDGGFPTTTATATASVTNQGVSKVVVTNPGTGYVIGDTLSFDSSSLIDPATGTPSATPSTVASLQISATGSVTVVDITDFGYGYEEGDSLIFNTLASPGNTGGEGFSLDILTTSETTVVNIDLENSLLTSVGIKVLNPGINVNDNISITSSGFNKTTPGNLLLTATDFVQVSGTKALIVPAGTTAQRPGTAINGAIRYNSTEQRYEGFSNGFFVSLGGVRDVDGNTYISAELNPGDDDNTLRFINDGSQSMQIEKNKITLQTIETIEKTNLEGVDPWEAGAVVTSPIDPLNDPPVLIYHESNVYSVDTSGELDVLTPPTHTSGTVTNGAVDLTYVRSIYGDILYRGSNLNLLLNEVNLNDNSLKLYSDISSVSIGTEQSELKFTFTSNNETLLKFSESGSLLVNTGFNGSEEFRQVLDYNLNNLNLKDTRIFTATGSIDTSVGNAINIPIVTYNLLSSSLDSYSGKVIVEITDDSVSPRRQYSEVSFLAKSDASDIFYTENNKIYTDVELCDISAGIDSSNNITIDVVDVTNSSTTIFTVKIISQLILT
jgi:hypothetical protein